MLSRENSKRNPVFGEEDGAGAWVHREPSCPFPRERHRAFWDLSVLKASLVLERSQVPGLPSR